MASNHVVAETYYDRFLYLVNNIFCKIYDFTSNLASKKY